jgi:hypothetical protein
VICRPGRQPVQGYNAQVVASPQQIILPAEITQAANDSGQVKPMITATSDALSAAGIDAQLDTVLADGGSWNSPQIGRLREQGLKPIVPTKSSVRVPRQEFETTWRVESWEWRVG